MEVGAYSLIDRLIHRAAFAHPRIQLALGALESEMFAAEVERNPVINPVFVMGLPRAGTTLVLNLLYGSGAFTSFTYRNMPFLTAPILWHRMAGAGRRTAVPVERAHGDGVSVDFDSPEAFEEAIWLMLLGRRIIAHDHLRTLDVGDVDEPTAQIIRSTISRLLASGKPGRRYLSKNNAHMGRIAALRRMFPDAQIIVVVREPASHIASLASIHARFKSMHRKDRFVSEYMRWIGHLDFGDNFLPIGFDGIRKWRHVDEEFWLRYWVAAYGTIAKMPELTIVEYDRLVSGEVRVLEMLADAARFCTTDGYLAQVATLMASPRNSPAVESQNIGLLREASAIHQQLRDRSI